MRLIHIQIKYKIQKKLIHIQLNTGVSNKLEHFKATDSQRQLRKILRLFSIVLFVLFIIVFFCLESPCYCSSRSKLNEIVTQKSDRATLRT